MYDLENTYYWLSREIHIYPYTLRVLVSNLHAEAEAGNFSRAWETMQALKNSREVTGHYEQALILMECGLAACKMHQPTQSIQDLKEAIRLLNQDNVPDPFRRDAQALAHWMLGNLILPYSSTPKNVTETWEKSLRAFENLGIEPDTFKNQRQWYQDRCAEMRQSINDAITWRMGAPFLQKAALYCGNIDTIDVRDHAPSGGPGMLQAANQVRLQPATESFRIGGKPYILYNLRGIRRLILLNSKHLYLVLRVPDDSMDKVGLEEGDYILIRRQEWAENGDMVVVQPNHNDDILTLRTYLKQEDKEVLQAQSSNPEHAIFETNLGAKQGNLQGSEAGDTGDEVNAVEREIEAENRPKIQGVLLGVFKLTGPLQTGRPVSADQREFHREPAYPGEESLSIFPVYAAIRAGKPTPVPERTDSSLESHRFWIDGKPYTLKNLRGAKRTTNKDSSRTIVLKVNGDSMNRAEIEDGDYVLLRLQETADSGDIVAAVIIGVDELATLKRFEIHGKNVVLKPESTNPQHQEHTFETSSSGDKEDDQPFFIAGVVIAVLKPWG